MVESRSRRLVVMQPHFFPWAGTFELMAAADCVVHYDDVQRPQGRSLVSRVQILRGSDSEWLSAPIDKKRSGRTILESYWADVVDWPARCLATLRHAYGRRPHGSSMLDLAQDLLLSGIQGVADFNIAVIERLSSVLGVTPRFQRSSEMGTTDGATQRLINLCVETGCDTYVTGDGAVRYLDYKAFEARGLKVMHVRYSRTPYPQNSNGFDPHVSILDALAALGPHTPEILAPRVMDWREYHASSASLAAPEEDRAT